MTTPVPPEDWNLNQVDHGLKGFRNQRLGELALAKKVITAPQLKAFLETAEKARVELEVILLREGVATQSQLHDLVNEMMIRDRPPSSSQPFASVPPDVLEVDPECIFDRNYVLIAEIGQGSMGRVWKAWDRALSRWVAIKILPEESSASAKLRFQREAQAAAGLRHPNLVTVYGAGECERRPYLVMELIEGRRFDPGAGLPQAVETLRKVALGLEEAHRHRIVHRDLKPANILIDAKGEPRVVDFGLVHFLDVGMQMTRLGGVLGTPLYMAPEQVEGRIRDIVPSSDVYALGAMLYEALAGRPPHLGETTSALYGKILRDSPRPPRLLNPKISVELETICLCALEKDPARRYASACAFAEDLARCLAGEPIQAHPPGIPYRLRKTIGRHRMAVGAAFAIAAILTASISLVLRTSRALDNYQARFHRGMEYWNRALGVAQGDSFDRELTGDLLAKAIEQFKQAQAISPDQNDPWLWIGRCWLMSGEGTKAEDAWSEALRKDPTFMPARFERGKYYVGNYARLRRAPGARASRGRIRFGRLGPESTEDRGWREKGEAELRAVRQTAGLEGDERQYLEGVLAYGEGRYPEALMCLTPYVTRNLWDARAQVLAAYAEYHLQEFAQAERHLTRALRLEIRASWHAARGHVRYGLGSISQSLEDYDAALRSQAENPDYLCYRGLALYSLGRFADAEESYSQSLQRRPEFAEALNNRGTVRVARHDLEGAERDFREAIRIQPLNAEAYNNLGNVLLLNGLTDEALQEFDTALELDPDYPEAYANRGLGRKGKNDWQAAMSDFRESLKRDPGNPEVLYELAQLAHAQGRIEDAIIFVREALQAATAEWPRRKAATRLLEDWSGKR